jgi:hypothetical protein
MLRPFRQAAAGAQGTLERLSDQLAARSNASPYKQLLHHGLHGTFREADIVSNLPIGKPLENANQHVLLSIGQGASGFTIAWPRPIGRLIG